MVCGPLKRAAAALVVIVLALALAAPVSAAPKAAGEERALALDSVAWLESVLSWLQEPVESAWRALSAGAEPAGTPSASEATTQTEDPGTDLGVGVDPNG